MRDLRPRSKRTIRVSPSHSHPRIKPTRLNHRDTRAFRLYILSQPSQTNPARRSPSPSPPSRTPTARSSRRIHPRIHTRVHVSSVVNVRTLLPRRLPRVNSSRSLSASARVFPQLAAARWLSSSSSSSIRSSRRLSIDESRRVRPSVRQSHRRGGGFPSVVDV